jgi:hypothetical protein
MVVLDTATGAALWERPIAIPAATQYLTPPAATVSNGIVYVAIPGRFPVPTDGGA